MKKIEGGVTAAKGFFAAGLEVGIKAGHTGKKIWQWYTAMYLVRWQELLPAMW